ncbi:MAG: hypothetical protein AB8B51_14215 [Sedimentitalea sp.]
MAVLALSRDGMRMRKWLQDLLWSDRPDKQGSGSLRSCLHEVRKALGPHSGVLISDSQSIRIDLDRVRVDVLAMTPEDWRKAVATRLDLLEGFDIRDPEFETWLRAERSKWQGAMASLAQTPTPAKPKTVTPTDKDLGPDWSFSVAVLPLQNRTGDPSLQFVAEGLSEDLIDSLQRVRWLPVIARASSFSKESELEDSRVQFVRSLGALYYVDGAISKAGDGFTVRLHLIQTESEQLLWSDTLELGILQEEALQQTLSDIVGAITRSVANTHQRRSLARPDYKLEYLDHIWRGRWHMGQFTSRDSQLAYQHFAQALELQPNASEALIQMGYWHLWGAWVKREKNESVYELAANFARRAAALDPDDGRCLSMLGTTMFWRQEHAEAETLLRQSLELMPSLALGHQQLGAVLLYADRPEEAILPMKTAIRYSPRDHLEFGFQTELAAALLQTGQYEEAWERATVGVARKPRYWYAHLVRILAARKIGDAWRIQNAQTGLKDSNLRLTPDHLDWLPLRDSEFREELASAMK